MPSWQEQVLTAIDDDPSGFAYVGQAQVYAVRSRSDDADFYYVIDLGWNVICAKCRGYRYRSDCQHVRDYLDQKGADREEKPPQGVDRPPLRSV